MKLSLETPTPLAYFANLVGSDSDFPLLEAAISLAQDAEPELDIQSVLDEVDQLQDQLRKKIPADATDLQKLRQLSQFFFRDKGFAVNLNDYDKPSNYHISTLLQTRQGACESLAVLWMELAQGLGLEARGVEFSGSFLLMVNLHYGVAIIDPATGKSLSREAVLERLAPEDKDMSLMRFTQAIEAARPRQIIARMLRNLRIIYHIENDLTKLLAVQQRLIVLLQ